MSLNKEFLPYKDVKQIGVGGFATVYTGTICGQRVIIKHFNKKTGVNWLIEREFSFSCIVDHPNIRKALALKEHFT